MTQPPPETTEEVTTENPHAGKERSEEVILDWSLMKTFDITPGARGSSIFDGWGDDDVDKCFWHDTMIYENGKKTKGNIVHAKNAFADGSDGVLMDTTDWEFEGWGMRELGFWADIPNNIQDFKLAKYDSIGFKLRVDPPVESTPMTHFSLKFGYKNAKTKGKVETLSANMIYVDPKGTELDVEIFLNELYYAMSVMMIDESIIPDILNNNIFMGPCGWSSDKFNGVKMYISNMVGYEYSEKKTRPTLEKEIANPDMADKLVALWGRLPMPKINSWRKQADDTDVSIFSYSEFLDMEEFVLYHDDCNTPTILMATETATTLKADYRDVAYIVELLDDKYGGSSNPNTGEVLPFALTAVASAAFVVILGTKKRRD